jgi:uncharacterized membrane protein YjfL (UPF0719 family)
MNGMLILEGLIEIVLSLVTGFIVFFASLKIFMLLTRSLDEQKELKKKNSAVAVVLLAFILALVLIVNKSVEPAMDTLKTLLGTEGVAAGFVLVAVLRIVAMYVIGMVIAIGVLWFAIAIYTGLTTRIDEMAELKKSNLAVGIVFATFIFSAGFICMEPVAAILKAFVPPPINPTIELTQTFVNTNILLQGLIELPLAFIGTIFSFLLGVLLSDLMTGAINETAELKKNNVASAIYTASSLFSLMYLVKAAALAPLYQALDSLIAGNADTTQIVVTIILIPVFFIVTGGIALLVTRLAQAVFMFLTKNIDEMAEIKKNNPAIALILAALTIAIIVLITHGMTVLAQGFIPTAQVAKGGGFTIPKMK